MRGDGAEIRHGGGHDKQIMFGKLPQNGLLHLPTRFHVDSPRDRRHRRGHRAGDQRHEMTCGECRFGNGRAHLAAAAIADVPHGIDRFTGGAGSEEDAEHEVILSGTKHAKNKLHAFHFILRRAGREDT
jgi:hypothetical protein